MILDGESAKGQKAGEESGDSLFFKIKWLMFFRAVLVTLLLGATAVVQLRETQFFKYVSPVYFYALIGFTYALTLLYALLLRHIRRLRAFAYVQILLDLFFITLLIYFTGGIASIFSWVYLFSIFSAGTILYRRGGLLIASASSILYGTLLDLEFYQVILPLGGRQPFYLDYQGTLCPLPDHGESNGLLPGRYPQLLPGGTDSTQGRRAEEANTSITGSWSASTSTSSRTWSAGSLPWTKSDRITSFNRMAEEITGYQVRGGLSGGDRHPLSRVFGLEALHRGSCGGGIEAPGVLPLGDQIPEEGRGPVDPGLFLLALYGIRPTGRSGAS